MDLYIECKWKEKSAIIISSRYGSCHIECEATFALTIIRNSFRSSKSLSLNIICTRSLYFILVLKKTLTIVVKTRVFNMTWSESGRCNNFIDIGYETLQIHFKKKFCQMLLVHLLTWLVLV